MTRFAPLQKDKHITAFITGQGLPESMLRSSFPTQTHSDASSGTGFAGTGISNEK